MEVAGLVVGVITAWKTCVQVFDVVAQSREYGADFEICRVKLEVERFRLQAWGDAVGLTVDASEQDARLKQEKSRQVVLQVLGGIQKCFTDTDQLRDRYGLIEESPRSELESSLPSWLQKAGSSFKKSSKSRQQSSTLKRKALWLIHDRTKFLQMVTDIRSYNDSLRDLFPDIGLRDALRKEMLLIKEIRPIELLQEAAADQPEVSDVASEILEERTNAGRSTIAPSTIAASNVAPSVIGSDARTVTSSSSKRSRMSFFKSSKGKEMMTKPPSVAESPSIAKYKGPATIEAAGDDEAAINVLEERLKAIDIYGDKQAAGGLRISIHGPSDWSAHVSSYVGWQGMKEDSSSWRERDRAFVALAHAAFEGYRQRKYIQKQEKSYSTDEDYVLLDAEANPKYEHQNTGTITPEGFALECWDYEKNFGKPHDSTILVSTTAAPDIRAGRLVRRLDELHRGTKRIGYNRETDLYDLEQFLQTGSTWVDPNRAYEISTQIGDLYSYLNRSDLFANFVTESAISTEWSNANTVWNLLWQIILGKELERRWANHPSSSHSGLTVKVLATVIIGDLWVKNVDIAKNPAQLLDAYKKTDDAAKAADLATRGEAALLTKRYHDTIDLYSQALQADGTKPTYLINRSVAYLNSGQYEQAIYDGYMASKLDEKSADAYLAMAKAYAAYDALDKTVEAYETAMTLAGSDKTEEMTKGLIDAKQKVSQFNKEVDAEKDPKVRHKKVSDQIDKNWEMVTSNIKFHSLVHETQVDGLRYFAERMKWPYVNELRDTVEDMYAGMHRGKQVNYIVADWLYGLSLPGKYFSFKLMTALIQCSPIATELGVAMYYASNVVLPTKSYWRTTSVLGRVLGPLPGVRSICGWLGPCPAVETDTKLPGLVRLKTRRVPPFKPKYDNTIYIGGKNSSYKLVRPAVDEDIGAYIEEMTTDENYITPQPPVQSMASVTLEKIKLKKLDPEVNAADESSDKEAEHRASLVFSLDGTEVSFTLYTSAIFVSLPVCYDGPHKYHNREASFFNLESVDIDMLKGHITDPDDEHCLLINATGKGADVFARAWCCESGKNAIVVKGQTCCFVCAVKAAEDMDIPVIIWVG